MHADLVGEEAALPARRRQLEVGVDRAGRADHLGGDGRLVKVALQDVDFEGALQRERGGSMKAGGAQQRLKVVLSVLSCCFSGQGPEIYQGDSCTEIWGSWSST